MTRGYPRCGVCFAVLHSIDPRRMGVRPGDSLLRRPNSAFESKWHPLACRYPACLSGSARRGCPAATETPDNAPRRHPPDRPAQPARDSSRSPAHIALSNTSCCANKAIGSVHHRSTLRQSLFTTFAKRPVPHAHHLIQDEHVGHDGRRNGKPQAGQHSGGIGPHRLVDEVFQFRKFDDARN